MEEKLTLKKFEEASEIVKKVTLNTNLIYSDYFSDQTGNQVYIKPENMQFTGAYKVRGSYYKISTLSDEERERGLITASAGNHAQGVAYAAKIFGVKATVVMPTVTPLMKVNRTKSYGADVILYGDVYDDACNYALNLAQKEGYTFIHPFDDLDVATGQGTIAMEIFKELPTVDYILVPIGGGGLATGVSTLAKMLNPRIKVIGVEPENAACMKASLKAGEVITLPSANTIADGTAVKTPGTKIFPYIKENIDDIITIKDEELIDALFASAAVGMIIGMNATLSGAEGGCQAECGSAAAMGAAAVVEMMGGTPKMSLDAAAIVIKNVLGLVCDPVAGLVEIPCAKRNAAGAISALCTADMVMAGVSSKITFDDTVSAMYKVGKSLPSSLRETALGGVAVTKSGLELRKKVFGEE